MIVTEKSRAVVASAGNVIKDVRISDPLWPRHSLPMPFQKASLAPRPTVSR
jgi:hypothetical protein